MADTLVYERRKDLSANALFRLSLYYIYVSPETWEVASLLNHLDKIKPRIATQEVESTYLYLHDTEHRMWVRAKDMARKESEELKRILRDEIGLGRERWDVDVVKPATPMAQLRQIHN